jgi:hypothetical protein
LLNEQGRISAGFFRMDTISKGTMYPNGTLTQGNTMGVPAKRDAERLEVTGQ